MPHSFICLQAHMCNNAPTICMNTETHTHSPLVCLAICSFAQAFTCSQYPRPFIWLSFIVLATHALIWSPQSLPPLLHHMLILSSTCSFYFSPIGLCRTHSFSHPHSLVSVTHSSSSPSHPVPSLTSWMTHSLTSLFILHSNSLWPSVLSPSMYRLLPLIPILDLRAPLSANQVVIRAAKIRGLINKGLSLLASGSLWLNRWHWSAF